jgi:hypothetical protein
MPLLPDLAQDLAFADLSGAGLTLTILSPGFRLVQAA